MVSDFTSLGIKKRDFKRDYWVDGLEPHIVKYFIEEFCGCLRKGSSCFANSTLTVIDIG